MNLVKADSEEIFGKLKIGLILYFPFLYKSVLLVFSLNGNK